MSAKSRANKAKKAAEAIEVPVATPPVDAKPKKAPKAKDEINDVQAEVAILRQQLAEETDPSKQKGIRRQLRARGWFGGQRKRTTTKDKARWDAFPTPQ